MVHILRACVPKAARVNLNLSATLPILRADATQLRQVIMNLMLNAGEAIGERGGVITITAAQVGPASGELPQNRIAPLGGEYASLEVLDTGEGMTAEQQKQAFTSVFKTTKRKGTGLGLAVVKRVVEAHRGRVEIKSRRGHGTAIRIILPA